MTWGHFNAKIRGKCHLCCLLGKAQQGGHNPCTRQSCSRFSALLSWPHPCFGRHAIVLNELFLAMEGMYSACVLYGCSHLPAGARPAPGASCFSCVVTALRPWEPPTALPAPWWPLTGLGDASSDGTWGPDPTSVWAPRTQVSSSQLVLIHPDSLALLLGDPVLEDTQQLIHAAPRIHLNCGVEAGQCFQLLLLPPAQAQELLLCLGPWQHFPIGTGQLALASKLPSSPSCHIPGLGHHCSSPMGVAPDKCAAPRLH